MTQHRLSIVIIFSVDALIRQGSGQRAHVKFRGRSFYGSLLQDKQVAMTEGTLN